MGGSAASMRGASGIAQCTAPWKPMGSTCCRRGLHGLLGVSPAVHARTPTAASADSRWPHMHTYPALTLLLGVRMSGLQL